MNRPNIAYTAIRSLFNSAILFLPAYCVAWLVLGHPPVFWQIFLASEALELATRWILRNRRRREIRDLQTAYDQPAYGDK